MAGLSANTHQIYATSASGSTVGSRLKIGWAILPQKTTGAPVVGNYPIQFDDVAPSAASNTWSGISTDSASGAIILKDRSSQTSFTGGAITIGDATTHTGSIVVGNTTFTFTDLNAPTTVPRLIVGGNNWLGGTAGFGVDGFVSNPANSNVVQITLFGVNTGSKWMRLGNSVHVQLAGTLSIPGGVISSLQFSFDESDLMLTSNFAASELIGGGTCTGTGGFAYHWQVRTVVGTKNVEISTVVATPAGALAGTAFAISYTFTCPASG